MGTSANRWHEFSSMGRSMANLQMDQLLQALIWKALCLIVLAGIAGLALRESLRWLERKATGAGHSRPAKRGTRPSMTRRTFTPPSCPAVPPPSVQPQVPAPPQLALDLEDLNWENFELLTGEIFRRKGFEVEICSGLGPDGGKDLTLRRDGELRLVQCKRLSAGNKVSVMDMRQ